MNPARGARYARLFERLAGAKQGAFIPFVMLGDPDAERSLAIVRHSPRRARTRSSWGCPFPTRSPTAP